MGDVSVCERVRWLVDHHNGMVSDVRLWVGVVDRLVGLMCVCMGMPARVLCALTPSADFMPIRCTKSFMLVRVLCCATSFTTTT